jgi:hypothetical protein
MASMRKTTRIALILGAWLAVLLAILAALAILSIWFLVPNNLALTQADNIQNKLGYCMTFALGFVVFAFLGRWAFKKIRQATLISTDSTT